MCGGRLHPEGKHVGLKMRRSFTPGTPRGSFGGIGLMTALIRFVPLADLQNS
jgi:hypothetical protein